MLERPRRRFGRFSLAGLLALSVLALSLDVVAPQAATAGSGGGLIEYTLQGNTWTAVNVVPNGAAGVVGDGVPFVDPVTQLQNAYASDPAGHLTEYTRLPAGNWVTADLTANANGPTIQPGPQPFTDQLTGFQNAYATSAGGHLTEFTRLPGGNWGAFDVTAAAGGPTISGSPIPFTDALTGFQNAYATSSRGHLTEFTRLPGGSWISADLTASAGGPAITGSPQPFTDPLTRFQNAYATTSGAHLAEYTRLPAGNWIAVDLTGVFGGQPVMGDPRPFTDPATGFQNAYATSQAGDLVEYTRLPPGNWSALDITATFGLPTIASDPGPFAVSTTQVAFGATSGGHLIGFSRSVAGTWTAGDMTQSANGPTVTGNPVGITDPFTHLLNVYDSQAPSDPIAPRVPGASSYAFGRAGTAGFTLVDTATGNVYTGGAADAQIRTASVIKVPIAMALVTLANSQGRGLTQNELNTLHLMITQSDNNAATALWNEVGGSGPVVGLMNSLGATNTHPYGPDPQAWGFTVTTSRDLAVVLAQLARGVLGPSGTDTILNEMHQVIPSQRWGIGAALPGAAVKNGWFPDPGDWRVNCLGIAGGTRFALAVMTQYPIGLGQVYGEDTCQQIAAQLLPDLTGSSSQVRALAPLAPLAPATVPAITGNGMTADGG